MLIALWHACAVASDGSAYCWGTNTSGQLGIGSLGAIGSPGESTPRPVTGGRTFTSLAARNEGSCARATDGRWHCWGRNANGELGDGTTLLRTAPVAAFAGYDSLSLANRSSCGLATGGAAFCWGSGAFGQLGNGGSAGSLAPVAVAGGHSFVALASGDEFHCGLDVAGAAFCWGSNHSGQLGDGTTIDRSTPAAVAGALTFTSLAAYGSTACGRTTSGTVECWGSNLHGELGRDAPPQFDPAPGPVASSRSYVSVVRGSHCAVAVDGTVECWGWNFEGQFTSPIGVGQHVHHPVPVLHPLELRTASISNLIACGIERTTGALYCAGRNGYGQLGAGFTGGDPSKTFATGYRVPIGVLPAP